MTSFLSNVWIWQGTPAAKQLEMERRIAMEEDRVLDMSEGVLLPVWLLFYPDLIDETHYIDGKRYVTIKLTSIYKIERTLDKLGEIDWDNVVTLQEIRDKLTE